MRKIMLIALMAVATAAMGQQAPSAPRGPQLDLKVLDRFASKANETAQIDMDESSLKVGASLLTDKKGDEAAAKKTVEGLKGLFLRAFEFEKPDDFKLEDIKPILDQLKAPDWTPLLRVKEKTEVMEIWMHRTNGEVDGMVLVAAERNALTVVNAIGITRLEDLSKLKAFGVPSLDLGGGKN